MNVWVVTFDVIQLKYGVLNPAIYSLTQMSIVYLLSEGTVDCCLKYPSIFNCLLPPGLQMATAINNCCLPPNITWRRFCSWVFARWYGWLKSQYHITEKKSNISPGLLVFSLDTKKALEDIRILAMTWEQWREREKRAIFKVLLIFSCTHYLTTDKIERSHIIVKR